MPLPNQVAGRALGLPALGAPCLAPPLQQLLLLQWPQWDRLVLQVLLQLLLLHPALIKRGLWMAQRMWGPSMQRPLSISSPMQHLVAHPASSRPSRQLPVGRWRQRGLQQRRLRLAGLHPHGGRSSRVSWGGLAGQQAPQGQLYNGLARETIMNITCGLESLFGLMEATERG